MSRSVKCTNYEQCVVAYRNDTLTIDDDAALVCPECGQPVKLVSAAGGGGGKGGMMKVILITSLFLVLLAAIVGVGLWVVSRSSAPESPAEVAVATPTPEPAPMDSPATIAPATTPTPAVATATPTAAPVAEASPAEVTVPSKIDLDARSSVNKQVKDEVLKRIDLMPTISAADKDQLYMSVERARQMGKTVTIPFAFGQRTLSFMDIENLRTALDSPQVREVLEDPTAVLVVLGYADTKGDPAKNLKISEDRAQIVLETMRDKLNVLNVMHSVGMGASTMFDEEGLEKNRVVEVWAVLP